MRLLIIGTHPEHTTGYSKIMYGMICALLKHTSIDISVFGIQRYFSETAETRKIEDPRLHVYDVVKHDQEDHGYGTKTLKHFIDICRPDTVLIYNDSYVTSQYCKIISQCEKVPKIITYFDQIYEHQSPEHFKIINETVSHVICFSEQWEKNAKQYGITAPTSYMRHPVSRPDVIYSTDYARNKLGLPVDTFIFLNLNRNQERKRPDLTIMGYVRFLKNYPKAKTLLIMGNTRDNTFNLKEIFNAECRRNDVNFAFEDYVKLNEKPLTDAEVQYLYSACDVGVNTCQGEGFGLCQYEHALHGRPQIVSAVGGLRDGFNSTNSIQLEPICYFYGPSENKITDMPMIVNVADIANGMATYYTDKKIYKLHSARAPEPVSWDTEIKKLIAVL